MLGHLRLAIAQNGRFLPLQDLFVRLVQEASWYRSLQLESVRKFQQMGRFTSSLVLRLESLHLLLLELLVFSESLRSLFFPLGLRWATPTLSSTSLSVLAHSRLRMPVLGFLVELFPWRSIVDSSLLDLRENEV